jgi:hypothetical protein
MIWIQKQDTFIVIIWGKNWSQRWNMETKPWQLHIPWKTKSPFWFYLIEDINNGIVIWWHIISYTVYNCPNAQKYRVNKMHIGPGSRDRYEFHWPDIIDLILNLMIWLQKRDTFIVIIWGKNGVRGEIWRQNHDKLHIP